ncbi:MAG: hypothetical protein ACF8OB_10275 [Phycisphaeraceae bacterium JB051]
MKITRLCVAMLTLFIITASSQAAPEPQIVPSDYQLDFDYATPQPIAIRSPKGNIQWYWYLTYTVTNNSGNDHLYIPDVTVSYDNGDIVQAGADIPASVFKAIQKKERNPLMLSPLQVVGELLQGKDFAKTSVAIWPHFGKDVKEMRIFIAGLSGETAKLKVKDQKEPVLLRKTRMLIYDVPGTGTHPQYQNIKRKTDTWIMR